MNEESLPLYHSFPALPAMFLLGVFCSPENQLLRCFLLPPEMLVLYKPNIEFITEHAVDPDKRRYAVAEEGPRHYIDIDHYGNYPFDSLPRKWEDAAAKYSQSILMENGIVPWWVQTMYRRLVNAFKEKDQTRILNCLPKLVITSPMHMYHCMPVVITMDN